MTLACYNSNRASYYALYNPDNELHIASGTVATNISSLRTTALSELWPATSGLPTGAPNTINSNTSSPIVATPNLSRCDSLVFQHSENSDWTSTAYILYPSVSCNKLVVVHNGHTESWEEAGTASLARSLIGCGMTVAMLAMPLCGPNPDVVAGGPDHHNNMSTISSGNFNALSVFLEPVHRTLTYLGSGYSSISMCGLSGGGWTTTFCGALDERIRTTIDIAGGYPRYWRDGPCSNSEDWEQGDSGAIGSFYSSSGISYLDLYTMCTSNARRYVQFRNQSDTIFFGDFWKLYERAVSGLAIQVNGSFQAHEYTYGGHAITQPVVTQCKTEFGVTEISGSLLEGLMWHHKHDEASNTSRADTLGSLTLTDNNNVPSAVGKINNCSDYDGSADYHSSAVFVPPLDKISIGFWFNADATAATEVLLAQYATPAGIKGRSWQIFHVGSNLYFRLHYAANGLNYVGRRTTGGFTSGWHFVVCQANISQGVSGIEIWIDGVRSDTTNDTAGTFVTMNPLTTSLTIAGQVDSDGNFYYNGRIDESFGYCRLLSQTEISRLYNNGNGLDYSNWLNTRRPLLMMNMLGSNHFTGGL